MIRGDNPLELELLSAGPAGRLYQVDLMLCCLEELEYGIIMGINSIGVYSSQTYTYSSRSDHRL